MYHTIQENSFLPVLGVREVPAYTQKIKHAITHQCFIQLEASWKQCITSLVSPPK